MEHLRIQTVLFLFIFCHMMDASRAARILGVPMPHSSHAYPLLQVGKVLRAKYNHTLTLVLPTYLLNHPMLEGEKFDFIESKKLEAANFPTSLGKIVNETLKGNTPFVDLVRMFGYMCESVLLDEDLMEKLKKEKFDLVLVMTAYATDCMNFIGYKLSLPIVHFGPFYEPVLNSIPYNPSVTPDFPLAHYGDDMAFLQRVKNTLLYYGKPFVYSYVYGSDMSTKYAPEKPYISVQDLRHQVQFSLFDFDVLMDYPRPLMPNAAFVGGLNTRPAKKLSEDFQSIMDSSVDGAVVVAFGAVFKAFPEDKLQLLFKAMKKVKPLKFIMKIGNASIQDENIIKRPWIPQNDLLGHKNTKAFITHCGNSAQYEALYHGVPMIGVPFSSDQPHNAQRMKSKQYGLVMPMRLLDADKFAAIIREVVHNPIYKNNIYKASQIFKSRPETPSERAAYWVDHVIKFGGTYMQSRGLSTPWYIYFGCDVAVAFIGVFLLILTLSVFLIRLLIACTQTLLIRKQKVKQS